MIPSVIFEIVTRCYPHPTVTSDCRWIWTGLIIAMNDESCQCKNAVCAARLWGNRDHPGRRGPAVRREPVRGSLVHPDRLDRLILFIDALVYKFKGRSPLMSDRLEFLIV